LVPHLNRVPPSRLVTAYRYCGGQPSKQAPESTHGPGCSGCQKQPTPGPITQQKKNSRPVQCAPSFPLHPTTTLWFFSSCAPSLFSSPQQLLHLCAFCHSHLPFSSPSLSTSFEHKSITMAEEVSRSRISACAEPTSPPSQFATALCPATGITPHCGFVLYAPRPPSQSTIACHLESSPKTSSCCGFMLSCLSGDGYKQCVAGRKKEGTIDERKWQGQGQKSTCNLWPQVATVVDWDRVFGFNITIALREPFADPDLFLARDYLRLCRCRRVADLPHAVLCSA
jgi:hypothetical protein